MRKTLLSTVASLFFALSMAFLFSSNSGGRADVSGQGATGAPGEPGSTCGSSTCHRDGAFTPVTIGLAISDLGGGVITEYEPGKLYNVTLDVVAGAGNPQGYGFQLTSLDGANDNAGTYSNTSAGVQISSASAVGGREYVEHDGVHPTGVVTFDWTAPAAGTGDVTFYFNGNAVNDNGNTLGDNAAGPQSLTITEVPGASTAIGDVDDLAVALDLFPTAASTQIQIQIEGLQGSFTAELFSMNGQRLQSIVCSSSQTSIDVTDLVPGTHLVRVTTEDGRSGTRRFVKQ